MQTVFLSTVSRRGLLGRPRWLSQPRKRRITRSLRQTAAYVRVQDHGDTHTHVLRTIWCVQRAGRRSERGVLRFRTWRGLSHLGLTGLGGRVTTGQAAGGSPRPGFRSGMENRARLSARSYYHTSDVLGAATWAGTGGRQVPIDFGCGSYIYPCQSRPLRSSLTFTGCHQGLWLLGRRVGGGGVESRVLVTGGCC